MNASGHIGNATQKPAAHGDEQRALDQVLRAIRSVKYGSVEIVIHDSRVVQVETREKIRFEKNAG